MGSWAFIVAWITQVGSIITLKKVFWIDWGDILSNSFESGKCDRKACGYFFSITVREGSWKNAALGAGKGQSTREHGRPWKIWVQSSFCRLNVFGGIVNYSTQWVFSTVPPSPPCVFLSLVVLVRKEYYKSSWAKHPFRKHRIKLKQQNQAHFEIWLGQFLRDAVGMAVSSVSSLILYSKIPGKDLWPFHGKIETPPPHKHSPTQAEADSGLRIISRANESSRFQVSRLGCRCQHSHSFALIWLTLQWS